MEGYCGEAICEVAIDMDGCAIPFDIIVEDEEVDEYLEFSCIVYKEVD
jgi:hypothetical protein